jgi:hypothetical protein
MGCSHFNPRNYYLEKTIDNPIDYNLEPMEDADLIEETVYIMKLIENMRDVLSDQLDNLILVTGAYCFPNPSIGACIKSVLIKVAFDNDGEAESIILASHKKPYLEIKGGTLSEEGVVVSSTLVTFLNNLYLQKERDKFLLLEDKLKTVRDYVKSDLFKNNSLLVEMALNCFVELEFAYKKLLDEADEELRNIEDNFIGAKSISRQAKHYKKKTLHDIICIARKDHNGYKGLANSQRSFYKTKNQVKLNIKAELYKV